MSKSFLEYVKRKMLNRSILMRDWENVDVECFAFRIIIYKHTHTHKTWENDDDRWTITMWFFFRIFHFLSSWFPSMCFMLSCTLFAFIFLSNWAYVIWKYDKLNETYHRKRSLQWLMYRKLNDRKTYLLILFKEEHKKPSFVSIENA